MIKNNKNNFIIGGSLDETFANELYAALCNVDKKYKITLIGMPNWDGFSSLNKKIKDSHFILHIKKKRIISQILFFEKNREKIIPTPQTYKKEALLFQTNKYNFSKKLKINS